MTTRGHHGLLMAGGGGGPATDPNFANVVALLHFEGANNSTTFTDQTGKAWTANNGAKITTGFAKYGAASGNLNAGSGNTITTPSHADFNFGSGDFTVELWAYLPGITGHNQGIVCRDQIGGTRGWLMYTQNPSDPKPGALSFSAWVGGTIYTVSDSASLATGTWHHVAACRDGGTLRLYKNGVQISNTAITGSVGAPSEPCAVGNLWGVGAAFGPDTIMNGYADELRITKGVCRYPGGTTFTPPGAAFPNS